jgi:hypothetical protein
MGGIFTGKLTFAYLTGFDKNLISFAGFSKMNLLSKLKNYQQFKKKFLEPITTTYLCKTPGTVGIP